MVSETVELAFADAGGAAAARGVLQAAGRTLIAGGPGRRAGAEPDQVDRSGLPAGTDVGAGAGTTVRVAGAGTAEDVRHLLDLLAEHGVPAARLSLHNPSLDEVFLTLTDRPAEPAARPLETIR